MPAPDLFGIKDYVRLLTAPAGMEAVHADGMSWAMNGLTYAESTKLTADEWNAIIGNLRGLLMGAGIDINTMDPASPLLLRTVVSAYIATKIVAEFPGLFLANKEDFATELAAIPAFVAAVVAAVPTSKVSKTGDTMTGPLTLPGNPAAALHAAPKQYVDAAIAALVASSPAVLDTLNELATALGNDANFATTVNNALATRALAARTLTAAGLATGGGDLTANRTITVTKSTNPQAIAGADDTTAMTPVRTKEAITAHQGAAKAWVNFNGTGTVAIRDSHNVTSITDNGVGDYTINIITAMVNANYAAVGSAVADQGGGTFNVGCVTSISQTTTALNIRTRAVNNTALDCTTINVAIFGD